MTVTIDKRLDELEQAAAPEAERPRYRLNPVAVTGPEDAQRRREAIGPEHIILFPRRACDPLGGDDGSP